MISAIRSAGNLLTSLEWRRHAKSQCRPSSRLMSSFEKQRPGMRPLFFSQKIAQKDPEKKMPSTAANAIHLSANEAFSRSHHFKAQCAFFWTHGTVSTACSKWAFSFGGCTFSRKIQLCLVNLSPCQAGSYQVRRTRCRKNFGALLSSGFEGILSEPWQLPEQNTKAQNCEQ